MVEYDFDVCLQLNVLSNILKRAKDGWEPVMAIPIQDDPGARGLRYVDLYFKRNVAPTE